ncbi:sigma 54-interacting transcriptional regulator [Haloferula sargassicola]|uniref:Nitrogen fixation protein VnfA n=1 Tax=Haloferula sargassicola TaxID=490096 RepID=A0ABP9UM93_9BACT
MVKERGPCRPKPGEEGFDCERDCGYYHDGPANSELEPVSDSICRVIQELSILFDVARSLQEGDDLTHDLNKALAGITESLSLFRATLRIRNRATDENRVEASCGLSPRDIAPDLDAADLYLSQRVMETAETIVIPDVRLPQRHLSAAEVAKTKPVCFSGSKTALIGVPVIHSGEVMGTLDLVGRCTSRELLESDLRLYSLVSQLIAQAVHLRRQAQEQLEYFRLENEKLQDQVQRHLRPDNMIGNSRAMQIVYHSIEQVAASNSTVLIRGESGVGKELVAHAIHRRSQREGKAFVKINCAALPDGIVESELFGHERGAFTGAVAMRKGRFELAHRGTIFLDEIGELPLQTQAKLLRILQEREFERVGGTATLRCDVRVIAATNRPLEEFVEEGKFRQDLYYRLNVFPVFVPALRERKTDILQLADFFVEKYNQANGKKIRRISTPAIDMLMSYHWPGNVRELENCIERATLLTTEEVIHGYHLPPTLQVPTANDAPNRSTLQAALDGVEREMIIDALKTHRGNMAAAARQLELTERVMGLRVKKHGIDWADYRE